MSRLILTANIFSCLRNVYKHKPKQILKQHVASNEKQCWETNCGKCLSNMMMISLQIVILFISNDDECVPHTLIEILLLYIEPLTVVLYYTATVYSEKCWRSISKIDVFLFVAAFYIIYLPSMYLAKRR